MRDRSRSTDPRRALGARGEALAARHLEQRGYRVLARNARADGVELDLVVRRGALIAFVEVKTRRGGAAVNATDAVDARKQARIARGAAAWLRAERAGAARGCLRARFDVVACIAHADGSSQIVHWPGAFDAPSSDAR